MDLSSVLRLGISLLIAVLPRTKQVLKSEVGSSTSPSSEPSDFKQVPATLKILNDKYVQEPHC